MSLSSVSKETTSFSISLENVRATEKFGKSLSVISSDVFNTSKELFDYTFDML